MKVVELRLLYSYKILDSWLAIISNKNKEPHRLNLIHRVQHDRKIQQIIQRGFLKNVMI